MIDLRRRIAGLRLRSKLAVILSIAAILPLAGASSVGVRLVLSSLESGVRQQTDRSLRVALNLLLASVKDLFEAAIALGEDPRLAEQLRASPAKVGALLERSGDDVPYGLIEVADGQGKVVARRASAPHLEELRLRDGADPIRRALAYERRVTLEVVSGRIVVRAAAPILDDTWQLCGAVVLTVPLDAQFADRLKAELATDVIFYLGDTPVASSLIAPDGRRRPGFPVPPSALAALARGATALAETNAFGRTFATGYAPLLDLDGRKLGLFAVASDDDNLVGAKRQAWQSIVLGGLLAFVLALVLAALASRSVVGPLSRLHESARAVTRGELDRPIARESGDEIGDLAEAFGQMNRAVRENQERLAARVREILTLQEIGRAVSSVLTLDDVLRRIVDQLSAVLSANRTALLFAGPSGSLQVGAAVGLEDSFELRQLCQLLYWWDGPLLIEDVSTVGELREAAAALGVSGSLLAVPLEQKDDILGLLLVNREAQPLSDTDLRLVATFADHAATAVQNARLYDAVQRASEGLERKVAERTAELGQAQSQLVLSDRMAGLGFLVAGIAHEINSPAAAIQGAIDSFPDNLEGLVARARQVAELGLLPDERTVYYALIDELTPRVGDLRLSAPAPVRRQARELADQLLADGVAEPAGAARILVEIGVADQPAAMARLLPLLRAHGVDGLVGYLEQYAYLHRNVQSIRLAVRRITRIVGALKGYSHLDQARAAPADIHEGIENTLVLLHHELSRGIVVRRKFGDIPSIPVYVDELNQVWTNLIHNAVQALGDRGEITIETVLRAGGVEVSVEDDGPGIAAEIQARIWEPFFTTKRPGEGTGLGLGIVRQIIDKHGGAITVASRPGSTRFTVRLPLAGPPQRASADEPGESLHAGGQRG